MTRAELRDRFAGQALATLLTHGYVQRDAYPDENRWMLRFNPQEAADRAYKYADAMLAERGDVEAGKVSDPRRRRRLRRRHAQIMKAQIEAAS